jgi:hypothetical protein
MEMFLVIVLPLVLCAVFVRNHLFAAVIYLGMLGLRHLDMTVMLFEGSEVLLVILALLFAALFAVEKLGKPSKGKTAGNMVWVLGIVRFPANFLYLGDIIFRAGHWGPVSDIPRDQPSLGAGIGSMLEVPLVVSVIMGTVLLFLYIVQMSGARKDKGGAEGGGSAG